MYFDFLFNEYFVIVVDFGCFLQQVVVDLLQFYVFEVDFVGGVVGGGEDFLVNYGWVIISFIDFCLGWV